MTSPVKIATPTRAVFYPVFPQSVQTNAVVLAIHITTVTSETRSVYKSSTILPFGAVNLDGKVTNHYIIIIIIIIVFAVF